MQINVLKKRAGQQKVEYKNRVYLVTKVGNEWGIACIETDALWRGFKTLKAAKQYMIEYF